MNLKELLSEIKILKQQIKQGHKLSEFHLKGINQGIITMYKIDPTIDNAMIFGEIAYELGINITQQKCDKDE